MLLPRVDLPEASRPHPVGPVSLQNSQGLVDNPGVGGLLTSDPGLWASREGELLPGGVGLGEQAAGVLCGAVRTKD